MTSFPRTECRRLSASNLEDMRRLLTTPPHGWCWCVAWEVSEWDGWCDRNEDENRILREELWSDGEFHTYLLYLEGRPVGWCKVGPRGTWPKLCQAFDLDPAELVHAFTCFGILEAERRRGHMHRFLPLVLDDLAQHGVERVEGFPIDSEDELEPGEVWMGPARLFASAGFTTVEIKGRNRHVIKQLQPV